MPIIFVGRSFSCGICVRKAVRLQPLKCTISRRTLANLPPPPPSHLCSTWKGILG